MKTLVLASTSKYRRQLLSRLQLPFLTENPGVDEDAFKRLGLEPLALAERLAREKCRSVQVRHPGAVVVGSDQLAALGGQILGKPGDEATALRQLTAMAGKTHELITSMVVSDGTRELTHTDTTRLRMAALPEAALRRYVAADRPLDCAGSYKIESLGIALFDVIETEDSTAIEGLPLMALARMLRIFGFAVP